VAKYPGLPVIVVTGLADAPGVPHVALFTKPFDTGALLAEVERLHAARTAGAAG
jgi:hypothetical protein